MPVTIGRRELLAALGSAAAAWPLAARAQVYPSRPITMVVSFAAGGPLDTLARIVAERMRASLGQPIIVENVTGAAGSIGTGRVARAIPDGYTLVIGIWTTHVVNGAIYTLQYDVLNDFEPIALLANNPQLIVAKKSMLANDLNELIAWLKANPDKALASAIIAVDVRRIGHAINRNEVFGTHTGLRFTQPALLCAYQ